MDQTLQNTTRRYARRIASGLLAVLLVAQLSLSIHDLQHSAADLSEQCVTCVHFDQLGTAVGFAAPSVPDLPASIFAASTPLAIAGAQTRLRPPTRAPPKA